MLRQWCASDDCRRCCDERSSRLQSRRGTASFAARLILQLSGMSFLWASGRTTTGTLHYLLGYRLAFWLLWHEVASSCPCADSFSRYRAEGCNEPQNLFKSLAQPILPDFYTTRHDTTLRTTLHYTKDIRDPKPLSRPAPWRSRGRDGCHARRATAGLRAASTRSANSFRSADSQVERRARA